MQYAQRRSRSWAGALLAGLMMAAAVASFAADSTAPAGAPQGAQWVKKKVFFVYAGLQTEYVCEGFRDQMRKVLLQLGARKSDLDVRETGCTSGFNQPTHFPGVAGTISVLQPAGPGQGDAANGAPGVVAAHWQPVQVQLDFPGRDVNGQCELIQQVKSHILPLFTTRNVQYDPNCSPRQLIVGGTSLRLEVLMADRRGDVARE
jgi:hypothetical protein